MGNKDKTRDGDAAATNRNHPANRDHSQDWESRDATLARIIAKAVALQTQSITEMFAKQTREAAKETHSMARSIYKANGEGSCAISGLIEGKLHSHLTNYP